MIQLSVGGGFGESIWRLGLKDGIEDGDIEHPVKRWMDKGMCVHCDISKLSFICGFPPVFEKLNFVGRT